MRLVRLRNVALVAAFFFVGSLASPAAYSQTGDQNPVPRADRQFNKSASWDSQLEAGRMYLTKGFWGGLQFEAPWVSLLNLTTMDYCNEENAADCLSSGQYLEVQGYAPSCEADPTSFCIESVSFRSEGSSWVTGQFVNYWDMTPEQKNLDDISNRVGQNGLERIDSFSTKKEWKSEPISGLIGSAPGPMMFQAEGEFSSTGQSYLVEPHFFQGFNKLGNDTLSEVGQPKISLTIRPILEVQSTDARGTLNYSGVVDGKKGMRGGGGTYRDQYFSVNNRTAYAGSFNEGVELKATFRIPKTIGGWFHGRLNAPNMEVSSYNSRQNTVTITAGSVKVPATHVAVQMFSDEGLKIANQIGWPNATDLARFKSWDNSKTGGPTGGFWGTDEGLGGFLPWSKSLGDSALGEIDMWLLKTINTPIPNKCLGRTDQLQGLVNTNAMVYQASLPSFENGFLNYQVAGVHFDLNGDVSAGVYDFIVRSETARCLYGYSNAPLSATVQVLGDQGAENIATTVVSEKDGWLKLAAYGFTFSEKEIKVKLTQPYSKTLTKFSGSTKSLSSKQKAEIKATVAKAKNNPKFICTGTYVSSSSKSTALARAKAACNYAKSLDKNHSYFAQAKQTSAMSYDAKVMITSK